MTPRKPAGSRRREIADAALALVAEEGLARFTALAIARRVGVTDAALFRHFPTKEAIALAVIDRAEEILFEGFLPPGADPLERLGAFFDRRIAVIRRNPGVARLVASEQLAQLAPPEGVARVAEFRRRSQSFVRQTLAEAHRRGLLAEGLSPDEAAVLVLGSLLALAHQGHGSGAADGLPRRVWRALERALRPAPATSGRRGRRPRTVEA